MSANPYNTIVCVDNRIKLVIVASFNTLSKITSYRMCRFDKEIENVNAVMWLQSKIYTFIQPTLYVWWILRSTVGSLIGIACDNGQVLSWLTFREPLFERKGRKQNNTSLKTTWSLRKAWYCFLLDTQDRL